MTDSNHNPMRGDQGSQKPPACSIRYVQGKGSCPNCGEPLYKSKIQGEHYTGDRSAGMAPKPRPSESPSQFGPYLQRRSSYAPDPSGSIPTKYKNVRDAPSPCESIQESKPRFEDQPGRPEWPRPSSAYGGPHIACNESPPTRPIEYHTPTDTGFVHGLECTKIMAQSEMVPMIDEDWDLCDHPYLYGPKAPISRIGSETSPATDRGASSELPSRSGVHQVDVLDRNDLSF